LSSEKSKKKSFISDLRSEGKINENFVNIVSNLTLEELIAIKLEDSANMTNGKLYNFPIWYSMPYICRDACFKFVYGVCDTKSDMASVLGIPYTNFIEIYRKYNREE